MTAIASNLPDVKKTWSNIDVTNYGPYREQLQFRLLLRLWHDDALKQEFISNPKDVLERESLIQLPAGMNVKVLEDKDDLFHFVLPRIPSEQEFDYRFQQIADWWMMAHALCWWQLRNGFDLAAVDGFRQGLNVLIIGRSWKDPEFKQAMITDAKQALSKEIGATFPNQLNVQAPVDTTDVTHFVIPKRPQDERLVEQSEHLAGWFAAAHAVWYWCVSARLLTPLSGTREDVLA